MKRFRGLNPLLRGVQGCVVLLLVFAFASMSFALDNVCVADRIGTDKELHIGEALQYHPFWEIHKFKDPTGEIGRALEKGAPLSQFRDSEYEVQIFAQNIALREGITQLANLLTSALNANCTASSTPWYCCTGAGTGTCTVTAWDAANAYLGVGTSTTGAAATQTGLIANPVYKAMDSGYPKEVTVGGGSYNSIEWRATFGSSDANQAWEEYSVSNSNSDSGVNLNRYATAKGTKASGESWTLSLKICFGTECT